MENKKNLQNVTKTPFIHLILHPSQHIIKPTRKVKSLKGHICSTVPNKLIHNDVIYIDEIKDHDVPFVISNIKKGRYEPYYKYSRDDLNQYVNDFSKLHLSLE